MFFFVFDLKFTFSCYIESHTVLYRESLSLTRVCPFHPISCLTGSVLTRVYTVGLPIYFWDSKKKAISTKSPFDSNVFSYTDAIVESTYVPPAIRQMLLVIQVKYYSFCRQITLHYFCRTYPQEFNTTFGMSCKSPTMHCKGYSAPFRLIVKFITTYMGSCASKRLLI